MTLRVEYHISPPDFPSGPDRSVAPSSRTRSPLRNRSSSGQSRSWSSRWLAPIILFLIGCFALGYYGYAILDARWFQRDESRKFDQELSDARAHNVPAAAAPAAPAHSSADELNAEASADLKSHSPRGGKPPFSSFASTSSFVAMSAFASTESPTVPVPNGAAAANLPPPAQGTRLGRIEIASLGLKAMIQEGTGYRTLERGVGHITGTALLGQSGNVGLAGHRDTFFRDLRNIHNGDEITLVTLGGDTHYEVDLISIVEPKDSGVLRNTGENLLTLVTCYPFNYIGNAPKRFIVRAKQVPTAK